MCIGKSLPSIANTIQINAGVFKRLDYPTCLALILPTVDTFPPALISLMLNTQFIK